MLRSSLATTTQTKFSRKSQVANGAVLAAWSRGRLAPSAMAVAAVSADASLLRRFGIGDAHCHPQRGLAATPPMRAFTLRPDDGEDTARRILALSAAHVAVMGTRLGDWADVEALAQAAPHKAGSRGAYVGEFGLDRAAVVPGSRLQPGWDHQLALTEAHLALAAELRRPVSMHCVQGYGHLQDMLRRLGPEGCPPKIMLHSYGGSVDLVKGFTRLPGGLGERIYFSFSDVINGRKPGQRAKLLQRLAAVPAERLLLESDQNSPAGCPCAPTCPH
eukprot:XP_001703755.1 predicted protein [Chlamydomonas reinhardtii]